ncbi:zinc finger, AN1-type domain [Nowakowskiella sp. JEL0078]|nr:zinc finger, AN1-type domain [Nowakowskiella sp. JEL0078]
MVGVDCVDPKNKKLIFYERNFLKSVLNALNLLATNLIFYLSNATFAQKFSVKTTGNFLHTLAQILRRTFKPQFAQVVPINRGEDPNTRVFDHINAGCPDPGTSTSGVAYTNRCTFKGCKQKELIPIVCKNCQQRFCIKHRLASDHKCSVTSPNVSRSNSPAQNAAQLRRPLTSQSGTSTPKNPSSSNSASQTSIRNFVNNYGNAASSGNTNSNNLTQVLTEEDQLALALQMSLEDQKTKSSSSTISVSS